MTLLLPFTIIGQHADSIEQDSIAKIDTLYGKQVYNIVEDMPEFPGGESELRKYLASNISFDTSKENINSRVYVTFIIDTNGTVVNASIVQQKNPDKLTALEESLLDIVKSMPDWIPGEHFGEKVSVRYTIPLNIHLQ
ncbi:energy transducer TonB [Carboxylicivirga sp. N1Y90]|uniref:energy transducer TonB n=1 Tax=Carboxylicivirga fragile TaxID=3417571 RepID=UPI003D3382A4|nr:energy transducer TonB [Marinilabiliaceae bacterium N1Y90]